MDPTRPHHAESTFGAGPRLPLDLGARCLWLARLDAARRARRITPAHELVGRAMLRRLGDDGRLDPSHATLAHDTGLSERTIYRALDAMAAAGLVTWRRRVIRVGARVLQTTSAYALTTAGAPLPKPLRIKREGCNAGVSGGQPPADLEVAAARAALAEVARRRAAVLGGGMRRGLTA